MEKAKIEIFFSIVPDWGFDHGYPFEQKEHVLDEIEKIIDTITLVEYKNINKSYLSFSVEQGNISEKIQNLFSVPDEEYLKISIEVNINFDDLLDELNNFGNADLINKEELLRDLPSFLSSKISNRVFEVLYLSQIARPGSLTLRQGVVWVNDKRKFHTIPKIVNLRDAYEYYLEKGYPNIQFINFSEYYSWLEANELVFNVAGKTSYHKAINNFSHFSDNGITALIYQMMTLEQLYTNSIHQISEQLHQKIQLYLGPISSYKKQIKKMYDIRSRFLHGDLPILPKHLEYEDDSYPKYEEDLCDAYRLSSLLVIATLQKMYQDDLLDLNFEYRLMTRN